jgi:hypothetical protein
MVRKKIRPVEGFVLFDVTYVDGTKSSRRKVAAAEIADLGEAHARTIIMDQDRKIAEMSGQDRGAIASIKRSQS